MSDWGMLLKRLQWLLTTFKFLALCGGFFRFLSGLGEAGMFLIKGLGRVVCSISSVGG